MSEAKAAIMAKGLTVNFNQKGAWGPVINSLYLFANAGIQGSTRIFKAIKNNPKEMGKLLGGTVLAAAGVAIANSAIGGYDDVDDHIKARNIVLMLPGTDGKFIKIPAPWGYNVFWALGTEIGDMFVKDGYEPLEGTSRMMSTALDAFNPLQSATVLQTLSPTLGDPFAQVGENRTFYGSPLMPEGNVFDKTPLPDSERYWSSVRKPSKLAASLINRATFGDKVKPGFIDVSPETLDLIFDTFTGGAGKFLANTLALPYNVITGDMAIHKTPIVRRLVGAKSEYKTVTDYIKNTRHIYQLQERIKEYPEKASKLRKDRTILLIKQAKNTDKSIRRLNKLAKKVKTKESKDRLKERIKKIRRGFNKKFIKYKENQP